MIRPRHILAAALVVTLLLAGALHAAPGAIPSDRVDSVREAFRNDGDFTVLFRWVIALFALIVLMLGAVAVQRWIQQRRLASRPIRVFHSLANDLNVPLGDQWLLVRIAHQQNLPTPLTLLLSPTTLHHHASGFVHTLKPRQQAPTLARVARLRRKLFSA
ncbi:MAG: hypothetical protein NTW19_15575 [Planctomycetota bacterium]|nr:hypothetical protein [Planctomycetota bacterium]